MVNQLVICLINAHRDHAEKDFLAESDEDRKIQITLSPWILLSVQIKKY